MIEDGSETRGGGLAGEGVITLGKAREPGRDPRWGRGRFRALDDVRRYWDALRGERLVPLRSEIDPRGIEEALDCAFIVERIAPSIARFRLAGSSLVEMMGSEVRGMPLSVMFTGESRRALGEAVEEVFRGPEALRLECSGERGLARPTLRAEMILLPLKSDLGDVSRALGCLAVEGSVGRAPRRLAIRSVERTDILDGRLHIEPAMPREPVRAEPAASVLRPAPAGPRLRPVPGAPHLKVVETAD